MRPTNPLLGLACCAFLASASSVFAAPTPIQTAAFDLTTRNQDFTFVEGLRTHVTGNVQPGTTATLSPIDPSYGPAALLSYDVFTDGSERTVRFTLESQDDSFFDDGILDDLEAPEPGGRYGITLFLSGLSDAEWDGMATVRSEVEFFDDNGRITGFATDNVPFLNATAGLASDVVPPSDPDFYFGAGRATRIERTLTYTVVPEPTGVSLLAVGSVGLLCRRRR